MKPTYKLFKRKSKKLFNTQWELVKFSESKKFESCFKKIKKDSKYIIQMSLNRGIKSYVQYEIREYSQDSWGDIVVSDTKRYNIDLEEQ